MSTTDDVAQALDSAAALVSVGAGLHPGVSVGAGLVRLVAALVRALGVDDAGEAIRQLAKSHGVGITDAELDADRAKVLERLDASEP